jgi:hypothetical protein
LAGGEVFTRQPDSPHFWHFLGLQRVSTAAPHFSQVKMAMKMLLSYNGIWIFKFRLVSLINVLGCQRSAFSFQQKQKSYYS